MALPFGHRCPLSGRRDMAAKKGICLSPLGNEDENYGLALLVDFRRHEPDQLVE